MQRRITIQEKPRTVSLILTVSKLSTTFVQVPIMLFVLVPFKLGLISNPKMFLACPEVTIIATADLNPEITGSEIKSITNPMAKK